ncbi:MAG: hypothetical protein ACI4SK_06185 [Christensenellales bacterium]
MYKWFNKQNRLVQILLLFIPFVNWIVEVLVRWSSVLGAKKVKLLNLLAAILVTVLGLAWGWIDVIWCLLFKRLTFTK